MFSLGFLSVSYCESWYRNVECSTGAGEVISGMVMVWYLWFSDSVQVQTSFSSGLDQRGKSYQEHVSFSLYLWQQWVLSTRLQILIQYLQIIQINIHLFAENTTDKEYLGKFYFQPFRFHIAKIRHLCRLCNVRIESEFCYIFFITIYFTYKNIQRKRTISSNELTKIDMS